MIPLLGSANFALAFVNVHHPSNRRELALWGVALFMILIAFGFRSIDTVDWACRPTSVYQGHAMWHLLAALSITTFYFYVRAERGVQFDKELLWEERGAADVDWEAESRRRDDEQEDEWDEEAMDIEVVCN